MTPNVYDRQLLADGRLLHHLGIMLQRDEHNVASPAVAAPTAVCAWCASEAGVAIDPKGPLVSHGICTRHLAQMKSDLESQRRQAA